MDSGIKSRQEPLKFEAHIIENDADVTGKRIRRLPIHMINLPQESPSHHQLNVKPNCRFKPMECAALLPNLLGNDKATK
jgi:hypothetical protein